MNHHLLSVEEIFRLFDTGIKGIKPAQADLLRNQYGLNKIREFKRHTPFRILIRQFTDFMIIVLMIAAIISGVIGDITDAIVILIIILLNALIGFIQEYKAEQAMEELKKMVAANALVIRDGSSFVIPSTLLVPGDLIQLEAGNIIPADARLIESHAFKVQESSLTGESQTTDKHASQLFEESLPIGDRQNMIYKGTIATQGRAKAIVVATGMNTELGRIATLLQQEEIKTPLQRRLIDFGKTLSLIILLICTVIFFIGYLRGEDLILMLLTSLSLAVAAIPEALPAVITIALARGAKKMIEKNALIRNLPAVETLGSVTYICSDKTGTLTQNKMSVYEIYNGFMKMNYKDFHKTGESFNNQLLLVAMTLNNDVHVTDNNDFNGDPTEVALLQFAVSHHCNKKELEDKFPRVAELPFDAERKCMSTIHQDGEEYVIFVKGAADVLLLNSRLTQEEKASWINNSEIMANDGLRVLGFAMKKISALPDQLQNQAIEDGLTMLGLTGLIDPPRPEARKAVAECKSAGIIPVMITGDHALTAKAIAKQLGIIEHVSDLAVTGPELLNMNTEELADKVEKIRVYARVSPEQKLTIVKALQNKGQIVAMTGDGVNDAPSLKTADVGVAMGITGTDVSKEASDMILTDDNFSSIVSAAKEGRRIFDNIRKFIRFVMTGNTGEIWTIFLAPFFGMPVPLLPIHILWVNLVTDGLPGLALAAEKAEPDLMNRPPRHPRESVFSGGLGLHVLWVGFLIGALCIIAQVIALKSGNNNWQTIVFTVLCFSQMGHVFAIRSEKEFLYKEGLFTNPKLVFAVTLTFCLQMAIIYIPFLNTVFKTAPLSIQDLLLTLALSLIVFHAVELEKWLKYRKLNR